MSWKEYASILSNSTLFYDIVSNHIHINRIFQAVIEDASTLSSDILEDVIYKVYCHVCSLIKSVDYTPIHTSVHIFDCVSHQSYVSHWLEFLRRTNAKYGSSDLIRLVYILKFIDSIN